MATLTIEQIDAILGDATASEKLWEDYAVATGLAGLLKPPDMYALPPIAVEAE